MFGIPIYGTDLDEQSDLNETEETPVTSSSESTPKKVGHTYEMDKTGIRRPCYLCNYEALVKLVSHAKGYEIHLCNTCTTRLTKPADNTRYSSLSEF